LLTSESLRYAWRKLRRRRPVTRRPDTTSLRGHRTWPVAQCDRPVASHIGAKPRIGANAASRTVSRDVGADPVTWPGAQTGQGGSRAALPAQGIVRGRAARLQDAYRGILVHIKRPTCGHLSPDQAAAPCQPGQRLRGKVTAAAVTGRGAYHLHACRSAPARPPGRLSTMKRGAGCGTGSGTSIREPLIGCRLHRWQQLQSAWDSSTGRKVPEDESRAG
jgi:hypothetical protein